MSTVSGMTGFGRASGEADWGSWTWEAKSVNGRGLDVRVNVPSGLDGMDQSVKKLAAKRFKRGNLQVSLRIEIGSASGVSVNTEALATIVEAYEAANKGELAKNTALATLMTIKGVVDVGGSNLRELVKDEAIGSVLLASAEEALNELAAAREEEGRSLTGVLMGALDEMDDHRKEAESHAGEQPKLLKERLETRLAELAAEQAVDADRLAAEVALTAAKADVREELDRLEAHIESGRNLLASTGAVGRKLDFLAQELNREANTLCSKSTSLALTNAGLALKSLIDQFKEQAANVE